MAIDPDSQAGASDHRDVLRAHGYHLLTVKEVIEETPDARSFVLEVPGDLSETFTYQPGQFCTFRVHIDGEEHLRSYSMSSAPETDPDLTVTVKRVPGGLVSNWFLDRLSAGDRIETTKPAGVFCLSDRDTPVVAFCGGSGVTPVMSIAKRVLHSTGRRMTMVYANRDRASVIFDQLLGRLEHDHAGRLEVHHHLDADAGFMDRDAVSGFASGALDADFYICGPTPFMDLVESTLLDLGVHTDRIYIERFLSGAQTSVPVPAATPETTAPKTGTPESSAVTPGSVTVIMKGKKTPIPYQPGDTLLETARRGGLNPPFSCESGSCATCMALLHEGSATMRVNNALTPEEVAEGWVLTCQALPAGDTVTVEYESY